MADHKQQDTNRTFRQAKAADAAAGAPLRDTDDAARQGAGAAEQGSRIAREALRRNGEALRQRAYALADSQRELVQGAAEQFEEVGRKVIRTMQQATEDWHALMTLPNPSDGGLQDLRGDVTNFVEGVTRTNVRAAQELFRMSSPAAILDLQRRFARDYLDAVMRGSALMVRMAHRAAEEALRPLEATIEHRQQARQDEQERPGRPAGLHDGKVADVMTTQVRVVGPDETVQQATKLMREHNIGALPVGEGDKLVGMITDRDVAMRLVAEGRDPARTKVREVMTPDVRYVFEDEELGHAAENMAEQNVRRLPVVNRDKRLVGVLSLGDLAANGNQRWLAGRALADAARGTDQPAHASAG